MEPRTRPPHDDQVSDEARACADTAALQGADRHANACSRWRRTVTADPDETFAVPVSSLQSGTSTTQASVGRPASAACILRM